jgi:hypothetical protein
MVAATTGRGRRGDGVPESDIRSEDYCEELLVALQEIVELKAERDATQPSAQDISRGTQMLEWWRSGWLLFLLLPRSGRVETVASSLLHLLLLPN